MRHGIGFVIFGAAVVVACSGSDATGVSTPRVGQACTATNTCGPAEQCLLGEPGGLCVKACTASGSASECPSGALCDRDSFLRDDGSGDQVLTVCLQQCEKDEQCRFGYACSGVSNGSGKVCRKQGK
ncbi:MAG: hypothetical protein JST00_35910 [Deltaproteobacteria bacterium]|nr:hypothetical protein [Deltaproteobacteria bacterium]